MRPSSPRSPAATSADRRRAPPETWAICTSASSTRTSAWPRPSGAETIPRGSWPDPRDRTGLEVSPDGYGDCRLDTGYRRVARLVAGAFAAAPDGGRLSQPIGLRSGVELPALYERQLSRTVVRTWDIAQALGMTYEPAPDIAQRVLRAVVLGIAQPLDGTRPGRPAGVDPAEAFACVLRLSGRGARAHILAS